MLLTAPYVVRVTDPTGLVFGELENAVVTSYDLGVLGDIPSASFTLPTLDPKGLLLNDFLTQREVQIWRRTTSGAAVLDFWGPVVRARVTMDTITYQAQGPLWYFSRLTVGPPLDNMVTNGDFESGLTGWTAVGCTASIDTANYYSGVQSAQLVSAAAGLDQYLEQSFSVTAPGGSALQVYIAAHFFLTASTGTPWIGPAFKERGLYIARSNGGGLIQEVWQPLQNSSPTNEWVGIYSPEGLAATPAGTTETYTVRLYSIGGTINWDTAVCRQADVNGSVGNPTGFLDIETTVGNLVSYAQASGQDKPLGLNIAAPSGTLGEIVSRLFYLYALANIWTDALQQFVKEGLCDIDVTWDSAGTTRQLNVYAKQGSARPDLALVMGGNVSAFALDSDGTQISGAVTVVGSQTGETAIGTVWPQCALLGYAVDLSANGGVTLAAVVQASLETTVDGMENNAATQLAALKRGAKTLTVTVVEPPGREGTIIGVLGVGDVVPVFVVYGSIQINDTFRVSALSLDPAKQALTVTLGLDVAGPAVLSPTARGLTETLAQRVTNLARKVA